MFQPFFCCHHQLRLNEETIQSRPTANDQPVTPFKAHLEILISAYFHLSLILIKFFHYSLGYTAKRKDEVHLPLGTEVTVIQRNNDRSYVVAFTKQNTELDRGWLPSYCLTLKAEATDINSKEGI